MPNQGPIRHRATPRALFEPCEPRLLLVAGQLDTSFGHLGVASTSFDAPVFADATTLARQPDGKILLAGSESGSPLLVRYLPDGRLDPTFADAGRLDLTDNRTFYQGSTIPGTIKAVLVQDTGRILLVNDTGIRCDVLALHPDGSPDTTFGHNGVASAGTGVTSTYASPRTATLLPDGSLLVVGTIERRDYSVFPTLVVSTQAAWTHILNDGSVDPVYDGHFRTLNLKRTTFASFERVAPLPAGGVIAVGRADDDALLVKLTPEGYATRAFGDAGVTRTDFGQPAEIARAVTLLPDGTIALAADSASDIVLARYTATGRRLHTFGAAGQVRLDLGANETTADLVVAPDGRLVLVGNTSATPDKPAAPFTAAFLQRGRLDRTYATAGVARLPFAPEPATATADNRADTSNAARAALLDGDHLLIAGRAPGTAEFPAAPRFALARLDSSGAPDPTFATTGVAVTPFRRAVSLTFGGTQNALQPDGKIVAVSTYSQGENVAIFTRFTADGRPDLTFGKAGVLRVTLGPDFTYPRNADLRLDPHGRILAVIEPTYSTMVPSNAVGAILRITPAGALDETFANGGRLDAGGVIAFQGDRLLVATARDGSMILRRFDADGRPDPTFANGAGQGEIVLTRDADSAAGVEGLLVAPDGKLLLLGSVSSDFNGEFGYLQSTAAVARFTAAGTPDPTFGQGGAVTLPRSDFRRHVHTGVVLPDGRLLLAGSASPGYPFGNLAAFLVRLQPNGALDTSYGENGEVGVTFPGSGAGGAGRIDAISLRPDGRVLVAGSSDYREDDASAPSAVAAMRLTPGGAIDPTYGDHGLALHLLRPSQSVADALITPDGAVIAAAFAFEDEPSLSVIKFLGDSAPAITAKIESGVLKITGTPAADQIVFHRHPDGIEVVSIPTRFNPAQFSHIEIQGLAGDDLIDASAMKIPITINAGDGNDSALGGSANDSLLGGPGHDTLFGGQGADTLLGDAGNDYLNPGPGIDRVETGPGKDQLFTRDAEVDTLLLTPSTILKLTDPTDLLA